MGVKNISVKNNFALAMMIIMVGMFVVGLTYAALVMTFSINVTNGVYNYSTVCFDIEYTRGNDVMGTLIPSSRPTGGLLGEFALGVSRSCSVTALGNVTLKVNTASSTLVQTVDAHCENSVTLETLSNYTSSSACTSANGIWVTSGTSLKYALFTDLDLSPVSVGYVTSAADISIYSNFNVSNTETNYYLYIWLDGNLVDNSYSSLSFSGKIDVSVQQIETQ